MLKIFFCKNVTIRCQPRFGNSCTIITALHTVLWWTYLIYFVIAGEWIPAPHSCQSFINKHWWIAYKYLQVFFLVLIGVENFNTVYNILCVFSQDVENLSTFQDGCSNRWIFRTPSVGLYQQEYPGA